MTVAEKEKSKVPQLRFPEFDGVWNIHYLKELSKSGFSNGVFNDKTKIGSGYKLINVKDMYEGDSINIDTLTLLQVDESEFKRNQVSFGDIFFTRSSIVAAGIAYSNINLSNDNDITFDGHLMRMSPDINKVDPEFLAINLRSQKPRRQFISRAKVSTMATIGQDDIASVKISTPLLQEQKKIAFFLSAVDKKISLLKQKHEQLVQYKKGIMQQLFSQQLRFKDDNGQGFPDWEVRPLSEVLDQVIRELPKPEDKYLALGVRSHMKGTFQKPDFNPNDIVMEKLYSVKENDLIVNITFAWEGAIAIVKEEDAGGLVSHRFPTYVFKDGKATHRYFKHIIQEKRFKYLLDLISPGGAGRNRVLSKKEFLKLKWALPAIGEQNKIADFLDAIDKKINLAHQQIEQTQAYKKGLLQQMFV